MEGFKEPKDSIELRAEEDGSWMLAAIASWVLALIVLNAF